MTTAAYRFLDTALWCAAAGHFLVLAASFQVPARLHWRTDLAQLMPFNRKLLWVQSSFTVLTIIAFGTLTLALHSELLRGDRAAVALAIFIAVYWTARVAVDFLYFSHSDWPSGRFFKAGHVALTALFTALSATFWAVVLWHRP